MEEKKKLVVFDFDGTLLSTPTKENGALVYQRKKGTPWPHIGWWSKPESLDDDIFEIQVIPYTVKEYRKEITNADSLVIMLTGRLPRLSHLVEKLLTKNGLVFDEYHYNNGGSTHISKIKTINDILQREKSIMEVVMYDDRDDHVPIFREFGSELVKSGRLNSFEVIHVKI